MFEFVGFIVYQDKFFLHYICYRFPSKFTIPYTSMLYYLYIHSSLQFTHWFCDKQDLLE